MTKFLLSSIAAVTLLSSGLLAGEKHMMHCFAFTAKPEATPADWEAFYKATDEMPSKMPMVKMVWAGKLRNPLAQFTIDAEARKQFNATTTTATVPATRLVRQYGACLAMENDGAATLKAYTAHPYHKVWTAAYEKVRVSGTTTYDIIGQ